MKINKLPVLKCLKCGHEWHPRIEGRPLTCPKCRQAGWDREKTNR